MKNANSLPETSSAMAWLVVALLFFLGVINFADKAVIGFAAIPIMHDLHLSHEEFGYIGSIFFWLFSLAAFLVGILSDRVSSKFLIAAMAIVWAGVQFSTVFISTFALLAISRLVLGAAEGPSYNLSLHFAAKWLPETKRSFGFSIINSGSALGPAIAAPVVVWIIHAYSWRLAFLALGISSLVWFLFWIILAKEGSDTHISRVETKPNVSLPKHNTSFMKRVRDIVSIRFILIAFLLFSTYWGLAVQIVWVPAYLEEIRHISRAQQQVYFALPWITGAILGPIFGWLSDYIWRKTQSTLKAFVYILSPCAILGAVCWYILIAVAKDSTIVALCLMGIGGLASPIFILSFAFVTRIVPINDRGTALGVIEALMSLGGLIGPAISGDLIQRNINSGYSEALVVVAWLSVVAAVLLGLTEIIQERRLTGESTPI
ncbi:MAG: MFS transporter [Burkholderiaceae bacterium]|nr:MAG: MFS transporter [Burkholderiaceae bacterium]